MPGSSAWPWPRGHAAAPFAQAWGDNETGQPGNGTNTDSRVPGTVST
jgi:hypothetical protein